MGSTLTVYVSVAGSVCAARSKLALHDEFEVTIAPLCRSSDTVTQGNVPAHALFVTWTVTCCEIVPLNVKAPFCPGVSRETGVAAALITNDPVASAGTSYSVTVVDPVDASFGSMSTVYVP